MTRTAPAAICVVMVLLVLALAPSVYRDERRFESRCNLLYASFQTIVRQLNEKTSLLALPLSTVGWFEEEADLHAESLKVHRCGRLPRGQAPRLQLTCELAH